MNTLYIVAGICFTERYPSHRGCWSRAFNVPIVKEFVSILAVSFQIVHETHFRSVRTTDLEMK